MYHELFQRGRPDLAREIQKVEKNKQPKEEALLAQSYFQNAAYSSTELDSGALLQRNSFHMRDPSFELDSSAHRHLPVHGTAFGGTEQADHY